MNLVCPWCLGIFSAEELQESLGDRLSLPQALDTIAGYGCGWVFNGTPCLPTASDDLTQDGFLDEEEAEEEDEQIFKPKRRNGSQPIPTYHQA